MTPNADYVGHSRSSEAGPPRAGEAVEAERRQDQAEPRNTAPPTINADTGRVIWNRYGLIRCFVCGEKAAIEHPEGGIFYCQKHGASLPPNDSFEPPP